MIQRSKLGLGDKPWAELLRPPIAGEFSAADIAPHIQHVARELRVKLQDEGVVMIRHGLVAVAEKAKDLCYIIDSDFYTESRVESNHALSILDEFNQKSARLFRWCIEETLHQAMGPTEVVD